MAQANGRPRTSLTRRGAGFGGGGDEGREPLRAGQVPQSCRDQRAGLGVDPERVAHRPAGEGAEETASAAVST